jgi:hypothetical protein
VTLRNTVALLLAAAAAASAAPPPAATNAPENGILQVLVTYQRYDSRLPWRRDRPGTREGYGVVVGPGEVVTTEDLIRNHTLVELRPTRSGVKLPATVRRSDSQANAALLAYAEGDPTRALRPVALAPRIAKSAPVRLVQFDDSGQPQTSEGQVMEIAVASLPSGPGSLLTFKVSTEMKVGGTGTPVFQDGRLAGLVMRYDRDEQTCSVLPTDVLRRFLESPTPTASCMAHAGFVWAPLLDPARRAFLGVTDETGGILVLRTLPGSGAAAVLKPQDAILDWDGLPVDPEGYYEDPDYGRLLLPHLINGRHAPGDTVRVGVVRDGRRQTLSLSLGTYDDRRALIPENVEGRQAAYLVEGGLVIRELTADYLQAYGSRWMLSANPRLVNLYLTRAQLPETPGDHVVILSGVLPDPVNVGYHQFRDEIITHVNGEVVRNLDDVFRVAEREGGIRRVALHSFGVDLVLDAAALPAANQRLAALYRIPALRQRAAAPAGASAPPPRRTE